MAPHTGQLAGPAVAEALGGLGCRRYAKGPCTVLALSGEIDQSSAVRFRVELEAAIDQRRARVVVDLTRVVFMDAAAVGELVHALGRTGWTKGSICLTGPSRLVRRVLELTQVGSVCPIYDTLDQAVVVPSGS